ncbi:MAG: hypothetical protein OXU31_03130 [Gammaproteobacteria bacterium]|nr:hypothetical protein [Gammaproteobacteria bacterium]
MKTKTQHAPTKRAKQHAKLLKEAMKHPGVKEFMEVYGGPSEDDADNIYPGIVEPGEVVFPAKSPRWIF